MTHDNKLYLTSETGSYWIRSGEYIRSNPEKIVDWLAGQAFVYELECVPPVALKYVAKILAEHGVTWREIAGRASHMDLGYQGIEEIVDHNYKVRNVNGFMRYINWCLRVRNEK